MFKKLKIKNFQSHEDTVIDFDKGVNIICGLSQSGKTAIIRALRLLFENRPLGGRFFSDFAGAKGETRIELELDDGRAISLTKTIKDKVVLKSTYAIGNTEFSGMKDQLPDQVQSALNLSELNMQRQFDEPFLINSAPGEIARVINRITKLEQVDEWVADFTNNINRDNREIVGLDAQIKKQEIELDRYADIEECGEIVKELKEIDKQLQMVQQRSFALDKKLTEYEVAYREAEKLQQYLDIEKDLIRAENLWTIIDKHARLTEMLGVVLSYSEAVKNMGLRLDDLADIKRSLDTASYHTEMERAACLAKFLESYANLCDDVKQAQLAYVVAKVNYTNELRELGRCPVCYTIINASQIKKIEDKL